MKTRRLYVMCLDMGWKQNQMCWRWMQDVLQWRQKTMKWRCVSNHLAKVLEVCRSSDRVMAVFKTSVVESAPLKEKKVVQAVYLN